MPSSSPRALKASTSTASPHRIHHRGASTSTASPRSIHYRRACPEGRQPRRCQPGRRQYRQLRHWHRRHLLPLQHYRVVLQPQPQAPQQHCCSRASLSTAKASGRRQAQSQNQPDQVASLADQHMRSGLGGQHALCSCSDGGGCGSTTGDGCGGRCAGLQLTVQALEVGPAREVSSPGTRHGGLGRPSCLEAVHCVSRCG